MVWSLHVHANSFEGHSFLADIGVDILSHGLWNWGKYKDLPTDSLPPEIKASLGCRKLKNKSVIHPL